MTAISSVEQLKNPVYTPSWLREALLVIGGSLLIALFANVAIPLPFTPIPLALQMNVCLFLGIFLGSKRATTAVVLFLAQGACGLPVFAQGGFGPAVLLGPRGGYLLGYLVGAFIAGYLWERAKTKSVGQAFLSMAAGNLIVYTLGVAHLSQFIGFDKALLLGIAPFVVGDVLKLVLNIRILKTCKSVA